MAGACGRTYRVDPTIDPAPCNALTQTATGLLVQGVEIEADPGLTVTAPAPGDCPQTWRIGVDSSWAQGPWSVAGVHDLNGPDRVYEQITEVATMVIPRAGVWEVNYAVRGAAILPANTAGGQYVTAALFQNGAIISGAEVMVVGVTQGAGTGPSHGAQATGSNVFMRFFAAGDQVTLHAYRIGQLGTASVINNGDGRTRVMAHWIGPTGDTPA
ncbi:hypothetical protein ABT255_03500 [Streptomyces mirabilis]|uniref:hypothetical protein n=1 Tax=Streptomyces mirabilis TaxID=68239 RepID=UPI00332C5C86